MDIATNSTLKIPFADVMKSTEIKDVNATMDSSSSELSVMCVLPTQHTILTLLAATAHQDMFLFKDSADLDMSHPLDLLHLLPPIVELMNKSSMESVLASTTFT